MEQIKNLQWQLLLNVLFGAIASRAFGEFYQSFYIDVDKLNENENRLQKKEFQFYLCLRNLVFASAFAFYIYDWIVLQKLYMEWPYAVKSFVSYLRFANDILMVFMLFGVVWHAAGTRIFTNPKLILYRLSTWHILAAFWHVLAWMQYGDKYKMPQPVLIWHLLVVQAAYWFTYLAVCKVCERRKYEDKHVKWAVLFFECLVILIMSFIRTYMVLKK